MDGLFWEVRTFKDNREVVHDLDEWPSLGSQEDAIETAQWHLKSGNYDYTQVTVHGIGYERDGDVVWDSRTVVEQFRAKHPWRLWWEEKKLAFTEFMARRGVHLDW